MKLLYKNGASGVLLRVKILDPASTMGAGKTGLSTNSGGLVTTSGLIISTIADNEVSATVYTTAASNVQTIATLGSYAAPSAGKCRFMEVDATNHPGLYEIQLADARFGVSGARTLVVTVLGASGAAQVDAEVQLTGVDLQDATAAGVSRLDAALSSRSAQTTADAIKAKTDNLPAAFPGLGSDGKVLLSAATHTGAVIPTVTTLTNAPAAIQDLLEADRVIDTTVSPWALVLIKKGTGALGQSGAVELLRQKLRDVNGAAVTNANTILGQSIT